MRATARLAAIGLAAMLARPASAQRAPGGATEPGSIEDVLTPLKHDSTVSGGANGPGGSATPPWITAARELFPLVPPALALRRMLESLSGFEHLHERLLQVLPASAAARLGVPQPDSGTREARTEWLREHWPGLLALDLESVGGALAGDDPLDHRTAATVVRRHAGSRMELAGTANDAERAAFPESFRAWCAGSEPPPAAGW
ncbi:MAG: hypothetical protein FJ296_00905 [Planctomycetes bacterium]|nr:hypothetical protein [Planctomycetota bacterium]